MDERIIDMPGSADEGVVAARSVAATPDASAAFAVAPASHAAEAPDGASAASASPSSADRTASPRADHAAPQSADHAATSHAGQPTHHHHSHAARSVHAGGHHLLQLDDVSVGFERYTGRGVLAPRETRFVVEHLSLSLHEGEILALVGASGSGKTLIADTIMGLFAANAQVTGRVWFDGAAMDERSLAPLRGNRIAFVPQSVESLDPLQRVGRQIERLAQGMTKQEARARRRELFARYRLDEEAARRYPFELSGGMARRALLIGALMNRPRVIVADEPTPGLDMELAVRAMDDFRAFANDGGGVLLITHDIELALRVADRIAVFEDGTVVEETAVASFASPDLLQHPFSKALWHALPEHGMRVENGTSAPEKRDAEALPCDDGEKRHSALCVDAMADASDAANSADAIGHVSLASASITDSASADDPAIAAAVNADDPTIVISTSASASASISANSEGEPPRPHGASRRLEAKGIRFSYGKQPVLDGFDLVVKPGERVALRAPSGTGKTTLCRILAGYLQPASGAVLVDGAPLPRRGASPVQLIAQHPERMMDPAITIRRSLAEATLSAKDAAALAAWERDWRGTALPDWNRRRDSLETTSRSGSSTDLSNNSALNSANRSITDHIDRKATLDQETHDHPEPNGLPTESSPFVPRLLDALGIQRAWLERFPSELSGGELQRCCIARALIARPRYLICDEISTMLDAATQAYLWRFLIDYTRGNGIGMVLVTHSDALLDRIATRIVEVPAARLDCQTS